jgi:hypothetical protein
MVVTTVVGNGRGRRELCVLHFHVPAKNFMVDQSGFSVKGIGVVSAPGVAAAKQLAPSASDATMSPRRNRIGLMRI